MGDISGDLHIDGNLGAKSMTVPDDSVVDATVSGNAAIDVDKMDEAVHHHGTNFDTAIGATPATREELVLAVKRAGSIRGFHALLNDTGSSTSIAFDVKVNGSTGAMGQITITSTGTNGAVVTASTVSGGLTAGQRVTISMAVTSNTGAQGAYAWLEYEEDF